MTHSEVAMKKATKGNWIPDVQKQHSLLTSIQVFEEHHLNRLADLGLWDSESIQEGLADVVLISNAKRMYKMLNIIDRYSATEHWIREDLEDLLADMSLQLSKLETLCESQT